MSDTETDTSKPGSEPADKSGMDERLDEAFSQPEKDNGKASGGGLVSLLGVVLALIAIGIASYPAYELYRQSVSNDAANSKVERQLVDIEKQNSSLTRDVSALGTRLAALSVGIEEVPVQLAELREFTTGELETIRNRLGSSSQDWLFAEVEYLLRIANQRVLMEGDASSALMLLKAADEIILEAEGLTAHALRASLAESIASLEAVNAVDVEGMYLEISSLVGQVSLLKRTVPGFKPESLAETPTAASESMFQGMLDFFADAASRFSRLIDFRRGESPVKPILPPGEEYYLRQNLVLKLQIAQMALLSQNGDVYRTSLLEARTWVSESFDADDAASRAIISSLGGLIEVDVGVELPDISSSLREARKLLAGFHQAQDR